MRWLSIRAASSWRPAWSMHWLETASDQRWVSAGSITYIMFSKKIQDAVGARLNAKSSVRYGFQDSKLRTMDDAKTFPARQKPEQKTPPVIIYAIQYLTQ